METKNKVTNIFPLKNIKKINLILNDAYKKIGNPIVMFDPIYKLLAYTENTVDDDPLWNELVNEGTFSHTTVSFFSQESFIKEVAKADAVFLKNSALKYDRISSKILNNKGEILGNICIVGCYKPFSEKNLEDAKQVCKSLAIELQKNEFYNNKKLFEEKFISKLIEGKNINNSVLKKGLEKFYTDLKSQIYVAVIDIANYDSTLSQLTYFKDLLQNINDDIKYFIYLNNIVAIISTDNETLSIKKDLNELNEFCSNNNIYVGISGGFQNLLELKNGYIEALNALNYGCNNNFNSKRHIFEYNNHKIYHFIGAIKKHLDIKNLCHPTIFLIQKYDKENKTSYYEILSVYLSVGRNKKLTAKMLKIKYKDLLHHLKMISEIFDVDWDNGDMALSLFMSIKTIQYFL